MEGNIFRSLIVKIGLLVIVIESLVFTSMGMYYNRRFAREIDKRIEAQVQWPGILMNRQLLRYESVMDQEMLSEFVGEELVDALVIDANNRVFYALHPEDLGKDVTELPDVDPRWFDHLVTDKPIIRRIEGREHFLMSITPLDDYPDFFVYIKVNTTHSEFQKAAMFWMFLAGSLGCIVLTSLALIVSIRKIVTQPLSVLEDNADHLARGNLDQDIAIVRDDELGHLAQSFVMMRDAIRAQIRQLEEFSHTLEDKVAERTQELEKERLHYKLLLTVYRDGIAIVNQDYQVTYTNARFAEMLGYTREEVLKLHVWDWDGELTKQETFANYPDLTKLDTIFETRHRRKDGTLFDVEVSACGTQVGDEALAFTVCRDISKRKRMEESLRHSEGRYRHLVENISEAIYTTDLEGTLTYISPSIQAIIGFTPDELVDRHFTELVVPEDVPLLTQNFPNRLAGELGVLEWRMLHKSGGFRWVHTSSQPTLSADNTIGLQGVLIDITERKQMEEALREGEARLQIALDALQAGVWEHNLTTGQAIWDERTYRLFGLDPSHENLTIEDVVAFIHPEDRIVKIPVYQQAVATGNVWEEEYRISWPDGSLHWIYAAGKIFRNDAGKAVRILGINFDISDRKRMETKIAEERNVLQVLINTIPDIIYVKDIQSRFLLANDACLQVLGFTDLAALIGKADTDLFPGELAEQYSAREAALFASGEAIINQEEETFHLQTGEPIWNLVTKVPLRDLQGTIIGLVGINHDITARKQSEKDLQQVNDDLKLRNEELVTLNQISQTVTTIIDLQEILDRTAEIMTRQFDARGAVIGLFDSQQTAFITSAHYTRKPTERNSLIGRTWPISQFHPSLGRQFLEKKRPVVIANAQMNPLSTPILDVLQSWNIWCLMLVPLLIRGEIIGGIIVSSDRPGREFSPNEAQLAETIAGQVTGTIENARLFKEAQLARENAEAANKAKSTFLANMSHELRTPLNGILGFAQFLQQDADITQLQRERVNIIEQCGNHLLALINDILDLAKVEAGRVELSPEDFNVSAFLRSVSEIIRVRAERKGLFFRLEQPATLPEFLHGDEQRLRQVLLNILGNAVKFTDHGEIILRVLEEHQSHNSSSQHAIAPQNHIIRFEVQDTGVGIAQEQLQAIFEPFQQVGDVTRQQEGTGLGLAISRKLIQLMGGELRVESVPGQGSTFRFAIPLAQATSKGSITPVETRPILGVRGEAPTLLIVDDNRESRQLLSDLLEPLGFTILKADDGKKALTQAKEHHPDGVITDIMMPGMDGLELIRQIRHIPELQDTIIIAVSARVYEEDRQQCFAAGSNDFLPKPVQADLLFGQLQRHLALTWLYKDDGPGVEDRNMTDAPIVVPPPDDIAMLLQLIVIGDMLALREYLDTLEQADSQLKSFVTTLRRLAMGFHIDAIRQFLLSCQQQSEEQQSEECFPNGGIISEMSSLAPELLDEFERAATCNEITLMNSLIDRLRRDHPTLADTLAKLAYNFEYQNILELVRKGKEYA